MTTLTVDQKTEVEKPVTRVAYFVEFHFSGGVLRVSTLGQPYTWGGYEWIGTGSLGSIDPVEESEQIISQPLNFSLNIAQSSLFALGVGEPSSYRGLPAKMYMCPLNESFQLVDTPVVCWRGFMDTMAMGLDASGNGKITLKCETSAYGIRRKSPLRINAAQQKSREPTDTGLDYLTDLISTPQVWASIALQAALATGRVK